MGLEGVALSYQMHVGQHEISFGPKATTRARNGNRNAGMRADRPEMVLVRQVPAFKGSDILSWIPRESMTGMTRKGLGAIVASHIWDGMAVTGWQSSANCVYRFTVDAKRS